MVNKSIEEKASELVWKEEMLSMLKKDEPFEAWCVEMGRKVNRGVTKRLRGYLYSPQKNLLNRWGLWQKGCDDKFWSRSYLKPTASNLLDL